MNGQGSLGDRVLQEQGLPVSRQQGHLRDLEIRMVNNPWVCAVAPPDQ